MVIKESTYYNYFPYRTDCNTIGLWKIIKKLVDEQQILKTLTFQGIITIQEREKAGQII